MKTMFKQLIALGWLVGLGVIVAGAASWSDVRGSFTRSFQVSGPVSLEVSNGSGDITVRQGGSASVEIRAKIHVGDRWFGSADVDRRVHAIETNPPLEQNGNTIRIRKFEEEDRNPHISIDYEIMAPAETQLHSETGSGDVTVDGIRGPVSARTGSGDVKMSGLHADVTAHTGSGDAKFQDIDAGRLEIETGSGDVELHEVRCAVQARTGSGDIEAQGEPQESWRLRTGSGDVTLRLPSDVGFDLDAHTGSGDVETNGLSITTEGTFGHGNLRGKVRGGGVPVEVQTSSGDIRID
jgi:Putative adhesin